MLDLGVWHPVVELLEDCRVSEVAESANYLGLNDDGLLVV